MFVAPENGISSPLMGGGREGGGFPRKDRRGVRDNLLSVIAGLDPAIHRGLGPAFRWTLGQAEGDNEEQGAGGEPWIE